MQLNLVPHPSTPPGNPELKVWATVEHAAPFGAMATLNIWFGVGAAASKFVIPEQSEDSARTDELWQTTCFETFLRESGGDAYREWNFAPSGNWAAYDFSGPRSGMKNPEIDSAPYIRVEDNLTWWGLGATVAVESGKEFDLNLAAVLEEKDGTKSYWALAHAPGKPDFHAADCFVAKLP